MANRQPRQTLADFVTIAVSPALIMAMVVSLVFFLVEVLLGPKCPGQLTWILFFFVFGAVLIARISMTAGIDDRAPLYGLIVGVLVWIAMRQYVKYPDDSQLANYDWLVNALLIVIVWWSTHRLTWDSTLIDDSHDASGAGLLQVAGLDDTPQAAKPVAVAAAPEQAKKRKREMGGLVGWVRRYQKYREEVNKRPHAPGVWVVWFSLAALPLFGIGQSLIPPADVASRRYAFWLMAVYVGSGLGLLVTTSFLNLRRYLRQRNLQMPMAMTGVWLTVGVCMIALLLVLGAVIPRPNAEYPLVDLAGLVGLKEPEKSRHPDGEPDAKSDKEQKSGEKGQEPGDKDEESGTKGKGIGVKGQESGVKGKESGVKGPKSGDNGQPTPPPVSTPSGLSELSFELLKLLKWIVGIIVGLLIAILLLRALLRFLANFTHWASGLLKSMQSLWDQLFGWWRGRLPEASFAEPEKAAPPPPFSTMRDPFLTGDAQRMPPAELLRVTFDALEAWAYEHDLPRQTGETPFEFVERLVIEYPALEANALELARLYVGLAYARRLPPAERMVVARKLWALLHQMAERPMSAGVE